MTTLSIREFGLENEGWISEHGTITKDDLKDISEHRTDSTATLNALPTPFARFFVVDEAFRRLYNERKNPQNAAGEAYHNLASKCLDVYELLFNLNLHRSRWQQTEDEDIRLHILTWTPGNDLNRLNQQCPTLASSLNGFYQQDIGLSQLYFIVLEKNRHRHLIATSSPLTGFITPPDMDSSLDELLRRPEDQGKPYFVGKMIPFEKRSVQFKNYMFHLADQGNMGSRMGMLRDYIKSFDQDPDIRHGEQNLEPIKTDDNEKIGD